MCELGKNLFSLEHNFSINSDEGCSWPVLACKFEWMSVIVMDHEYVFTVFDAIEKSFGAYSVGTGSRV